MIASITKKVSGRLAMTIQRVQWNLLCEWYCAPVDATENEVIDYVLTQFSMDSIGLSDKDLRPLLKSRLYGGWTCEDKKNRHISLDTGAFCYTEPHGNIPLSSDCRADRWRKLVEVTNGKDCGYIGGGPFCEDYPDETV